MKTEHHRDTSQRPLVPKIAQSVALQNLETQLSSPSHFCFHFLPPNVAGTELIQYLVLAVLVSRVTNSGYNSDICLNFLISYLHKVLKYGTEFVWS